MEQFYCKYSKIIFLQSILHYLKVVVRINFYLTVFFLNIFYHLCIAINEGKIKIVLAWKIKINLNHTLHF